MRAKKEKTEFGSVKSVVPKKKKAFYGTVVPPLKVDNSAEKPPTEQGSGTPADSEPTEDEAEMPMTPEDYENGEASEETEPSEASEVEKEYTPDETMEKLQKLVESMEEYQKQKAEEEEKKKEEEQAEKEEEQPKSEEEKKQDEQQKQKQENENELTKYLTLQLRIRALGEIFGAVKIAKKEKEYFSFTAFEGTQGFVTFRTPPAPENVIVALSVFPYFETRDEAEAFVELCEEILLDYGRIAYSLNAQEFAGLPIKVTYPNPPKV